MIIIYNFQYKRRQKKHVYFIDSICLGPSCFCFLVLLTKGLFPALCLPTSCTLNLLNPDSFSFTQLICWTQLGFPFLSQFSGKMLLSRNIWELQIELIGTSLVSQWLKNLSVNSEDLRSILESGRFLGGGNDSPLQYSCLENPWTEEPGGLQSVGCQRVGHD